MTDTPLLTLSQVRDWERRNALIVDQLRVLQEEQRELQRKLGAASVFMPIEAEPSPTESTLTEDEPPVEEEVDGGNLSELVLEAVEQLGGSPGPKRIRRWVANNNQVLSAKLAASPNYFYTILARHVRKGRLIKDGDGYKLPSDSAQAETGAVAAPAPLESASQSMEAAYDGPKGNGLL